jgi:hypothetical protein
VRLVSVNTYILFKPRTQSPVAFAISSPTFFGDNPSGPILGANADEAPTSPPVARRCLFHSLAAALEMLYLSITHMTFTSLGSNLGAVGNFNHQYGYVKGSGRFTHGVGNLSAVLCALCCMKINDMMLAEYRVVCGITKTPLMIEVQVPSPSLVDTTEALSHSNARHRLMLL